MGVLWRRVYELSGGTWSRRREAWVTVFDAPPTVTTVYHPHDFGAVPSEADEPPGDNPWDRGLDR